MNVGLASLLALRERMRTQAPWLAVAFGECGTKEMRGLDDNSPRILEYISSFPYLKNTRYSYKDRKTKKTVVTDYPMSEVDETAWCACFVNWSLRQVGQPTNGMNAAAKKWIEFGIGLPRSTPQLGAIAVVHKPPSRATADTTSSGDHVAFYVSGPADAPVLLGGNQGNKVCIKQFNGWSVLAYRWPSTFMPRQGEPPNLA